jgi:hypothetical protein
MGNGEGNMQVDEFETYRASFDRLLRLANEQLDDIGRNRIYHAVKLRRDDWLAQGRDTPAENLGRSLVELLADAEANAEVTADQVAELEQLVYARLPQFDDPRR